jgi:hypothetical protein
MDYKEKYRKYKIKYLELKNINNQTGGVKKLNNKKFNNIINSNNMRMSTKNYIENISEPWFTLISLGLKTVEGRKNKGRFKEMQVGEIIE